MWEFLSAGGPFMILLVLTSIVSVTFIVERLIALRRSRVVPVEIEAAVGSCQGPQDVEMLERLCRQRPSSLSRLLAVAAQHLDWPRAETVDALETQARREVILLERGLVVLEVIVGIAPLLGLVGTIHGLITLFGDLGRTGLSDNATLAKGIAIALNTTLTGLLIAIPSLVAWSFYSKRVETFAVEMETVCDEFLRRQYRARGDQAGPAARRGTVSWRRGDDAPPAEPPSTPSAPPTPRGPRP